MKRNTTIGIILIIIALLCFVFAKTKIIDSTYLTFDMLQSRKGTILVEKCIGIVTDFDKNGEVLNGLGEFNYISYKKVRKANINDVYITYFVYNPLNNIEDDILFRLDLKL